MQYNWSYQYADYRGVIQFPSVVDQITGTTYGMMDVPLYIQDMPVPIRKPKITEMNTLGMPTYDYDMDYRAAFYGTNEPLSVTFSGFILTPQVSVTEPATGARYKQWFITELNLTGHSYPDVITAYVEGRMKRMTNGRGHRVDPYQFIDPYGNVYGSPKIVTYEFAYTPNPRKQTFSMTLYLENNR